MDIPGVGNDSLTTPPPHTLNSSVAPTSAMAIRIQTGKIKGFSKVCNRIYKPGKFRFSSVKILINNQFIYNIIDYYSLHKFLLIIISTIFFIIMTRQGDKLLRHISSLELLPTVEAPTMIQNSDLDRGACLDPVQCGGPDPHAEVIGIVSLQ